MMARVWTIARRELRAFFDHATAYILLVVFLGIAFFFFFRDAYLLDEASLRPMMGLLPWLLLFFVPAVCMRALAEERRAGTLEVVLAQPISVPEYLLGKFAGVFLFLCVALAGTLGVPIGLDLLTAGVGLQWGVIVAQYIGAAFLIAALVSIGMWASAMTSNQVTAFILGVAITFALYLIGLDIVVLGLPGVLATLASRLGILGHFENVARGVIDTRDVLYFIAVTAAFLSLTYFSVMREKLSRRREAYRRLSLGTLGLVALAIFASLAGGQLRGRLDLTPGKLYTLSAPTRALVEGLDDLVTIKFFRSKEIPPAFAPIRRDAEDLLRDFDAAGGTNINFVQLSPGDDEEAEAEARTLGIQPVEFNVIGEEELQVRSGYLGLAVQYAGQTEIIPVVQQTTDLEYRLASMIRTMTSERRPVVAFLTGHGELDLSSQIRAVNARIREEYQVQTLRLDSTVVAVPDSIEVLVIAGLRAPLSEREGDLLNEYVDRGGSLLVMVAGTDFDQQTLFARPAFHPVLDRLLARYGTGVEPAVAYDLQARQSVQLQGPGGFVVLRVYPPWPLAQPASDHPIARDVGGVPMRWASPLRIDESVDSAAVIPLLTTTTLGGSLRAPVSVDATQDWSLVISEEDLVPQLLAAAFLGGTGTAAVSPPSPEGETAPEPAPATEGEEAIDESGAAPEPEAAAAGASDVSGAGNDRPRGRLVLIGSPSLVVDEVLQTGFAGLVLFQNAVDWLAQDEALISIRSKDRSPPQLIFESGFRRDLAKYGNLIGVPLLFILYGVMRLARRRSLEGRVYQPQHGGAS